MDDQAEIRFEDDSGDEYVAIQASTGTTTHTYNLPTAQGAASEVLGNDGSGNLSWMAALTNSLTDDHIFIGDGSNTSTAVNTSLVGDILADHSGGMTVKSGAALPSPVMTTPQINDTSSDHQYIFAVSELAADRTVTLPLLTGNDTFVFADHTQTLTNKTLTTPVISQISNTGTLTLPTSTDTLVGRDTTDTLTNKTLGDTNTINAQSDAFTIDDSADATKQIDFALSGATTGAKITLTSDASADRTITFPDATGTLAERSAAVEADRVHTPGDANYTITDTDGYDTIVYATTLTADRTVTLPTSADNKGRIITIKRTVGGDETITIDGEGAETIDGATTTSLNGKYDTVTIESDGTNWVTLHRKQTPFKVRYYVGSTHSVTAGNPVQYDTEDATLVKIGDDWSISSGVITVPSPGDYMVHAVADFASAASSYYTVISLGGTAKKRGQFSGTADAPEVFGTITIADPSTETITIEGTQNFTNIQASILGAWIEISRVPDE
jgi:hypothetical protein